MATTQDTLALKTRLAGKVAAMRDEVKDLLARHGDTKISDVTVAQAYGGMRSVKCMVTETSAVDPQEGIRFRGYSIPELQDKLPKAAGGSEPLPEGVFSLLLTGELPTDAEVAEIRSVWRGSEALPEHVTRAVDCLPLDTHPMTQFSLGILAMQHGSLFAARYREGIHKNDHWEAVLDDSMVLLGRLPVLAAHVYRRTYKNGRHIPPGEAGLDWAGNLAHMLGVDRAEFKDFMRLYLSILADHEGGNVSAHATHLVGSALSDPYYALSAGMNGLAGPLHGLATQEALRWIVEVREKLGGRVPSREELERYLWDTLNAGQVVPGFGHAVLRKTDPRYMAQRQFALQHLPQDENFKIVDMLYDLAPDILTRHGKTKNPWPNVDAHSGALFVHYGITEHDFYTVLFGVSRAMGVLASLVWDRALGLPIERPKSVTTQWIHDEMSKARPPS